MDAVGTNGVGFAFFSFRAVAIWTHAASKIEQTRPTQDDADVATSLATNFQTVAGRSDYSSYSSVSAALVGISRTRVLALLSLPPSP